MAEDRRGAGSGHSTLAPQMRDAKAYFYDTIADEFDAVSNQYDTTRRLDRCCTSPPARSGNATLSTCPCRHPQHPQQLRRLDRRRRTKRKERERCE